MRSRIVTTMGLAAMLWAGGAQAEWRTLDPALGNGQGAGGCVDSEENYSCILLRCKAGKTTWALIFTGGDLAPGNTAPVYFRVDDAAAERLEMRAVSTFGTMEWEADFDPAAHAALIEKLQRGNRVSFRAGRPPEGHPWPISLRGSSRALDAALRICPAPEVEVPRFNAASERFLSLDFAATTPQDQALGERLMAGDIVQIGAEAETHVAGFDVAPGKRLMAVETGPSTMLYGIAGSNLAIFALNEGQPVQVFSSPGTALWLDLENRRDGWPDLWMTSMRGFDNPFGVWTWTGETYRHSHNVAP